MREGTILSNWTDIVQRSSQIIALENIDLKGTWFDPNLDGDPRKTPSNKPSVAPDNSNNTLTLLQSIPHVQESPASKGAYVSEVIERPSPKGFQDASNPKKVGFTQQSSNVTSGMISSKEKGIKTPKMIDIASTGIRRSTSLAHNPNKIIFLC